MNKIKENIYLKYTVLFLVIFLIGFLPLEIRNQRSFLSGVFVHQDTWLDGLKQHTLFLYDYVRVIKDFIINGTPITTYRFDIGMGESFVASYTYYSLFDPITIIAYIIPLKHIDISYSLMIITRLYLTGIFMIYLLKYLKYKQSHILITTLFYVFSYTVLFSAIRHPMFINGPMYLPLLYLGILKVYNKESSWLLILSVFLLTISQFYMAVYSLVGIELYILVRTIKTKEYSLFIKINIRILLGLLLSSFVLVPQVFAVLLGSRASTKGIHLFSPEYYGKFMLAMGLPIGSISSYTLLIQNIFVSSAMLLYMREKKCKDIQSIIVLIIFVFILFPIFGYVLSLFSYVNNRYSFILVFYGALMFIEYIKDRKQIRPDEVRFLIIIFLTTIISSVLILIPSQFYLSFRTNQLLLIVVTLLIFTTVYGVYRLSSKIPKINITISPFKYGNILFISSIIIGMLFLSSNYREMTSPANAFVDYYQESTLFDIVDEPYYRVEQHTYTTGIHSFSNDGIYYQYPSTSLYNTMTNGNVIASLELFDVNNENNTVGYNGLDFRSNLLGINYVKYLIIRESDLITVPPQYEVYKTVQLPKIDYTQSIASNQERYVYDNDEIVYENVYIYVDQSPLGFGLLYQDYILEDNRTGLEYQQIVYDYLILEEELDFKEPVSYNNEIVRIPITPSGVDIDEKVDGGIYEYTISNQIDGEVYLYIKGIKKIDPQDKFHIEIKGDNIDTRLVYYAYTGNMYYENETTIIRLGYYENINNLSFTLELESGEFTYEEISYSIIGLQNDKKALLDDEVLSDVVFNENGFSATIDNQKTGILYLPVVYDHGFTAYIDGVEVDIIKVNQAMSAVYINQNETLEFVYQTPGIYLGSIITGISFIAILGILLFEKRNGKYEKN